jgi:acyl-coenzyme A thioesterase PaaI-like protein
VSEAASPIGAEPAGDALPPHYVGCLGCGPDAAHGYHLQVRREGDEVVTEHLFAVEQTGAPGIAHGGAVATVVDDVLGFLLYVVDDAAVTRRLVVEYLRPVLVGTRYAVRARVDRRDGRKLFFSCTGTGPDGVVAFRGEGLFVVVDVSHFVRHGSAASSGGGHHPVAP